MRRGTRPRVRRNAVDSLGRRWCKAWHQERAVWWGMRGPPGGAGVVADRANCWTSATAMRSWIASTSRRVFAARMGPPAAAGRWGSSTTCAGGHGAKGPGLVCGGDKESAKVFVAPSFARRSASSLPGIPTCARIFWITQGAVRTNRAWCKMSARRAWCWWSTVLSVRWRVEWSCCREVKLSEAIWRGAFKGALRTAHQIPVSSPRWTVRG